MNAEHIRELNDAFRCSLIGGRVALSASVAALPDRLPHAIVRHVQAFSAFTVDNDPHGEHDLGSFNHDEYQICWKIGYYDPQMETGSDDPADPTRTTRVLTIMLVSEY